MAQPWPFFFLATFLAAFFFFLAMELAPSREHPESISRPIPRVFQGEATDVSPSREPDLSCPIDVDERVVRDGTENCQEKFTKFFRESAGPVGRSCIPPARPSRADTVCDRAAWCVVSAAVRVVFSLR
jgi:hypothetical protein